MQRRWIIGPLGAFSQQLHSHGLDWRDPVARMSVFRTPRRSPPGRGRVSPQEGRPALLGRRRCSASRRRRGRTSQVRRRHRVTDSSYFLLTAWWRLRALPDLRRGHGKLSWSSQINSPTNSPFNRASAPGSLYCDIPHSYNNMLATSTVCGLEKAKQNLNYSFPLTWKTNGF